MFEFAAQSEKRPMHLSDAFERSTDYAGMSERLRQSGLEIIGDIPWGTHFCQFYSTKEDLLDTLVPYFAAGLAANEFCIWVTAASLGVDDAHAALREAVPDLDLYLAKGQIEILDQSQPDAWPGAFYGDRILHGRSNKLDGAFERGYDGLRLSLDIFLLEKNESPDFACQEAEFRKTCTSKPMLALCTYSLQKCGVADIPDVVANHEYALVRKAGRWQVLKSYERYGAEHGIRESEERLRTLVDQASDGIFVSDALGYCVSVNSVGCRMLGYKAEDISRLRIEDVIVADDAWRVPDELARLRNGETVVSEWRFRRKDGSLFTGEVSARQLPDGRIQAFLRDITERKKIESAFVESKERLRLALDAAKMGTYLVDRATHKATIDAVQAHLLGLPEGTTSVHTSAIIARFNPEDLAIGRANRERSFRGDGAFQNEYRLKMADGSERWIASYAAVRKGMVFGVTCDITERKQAEEQLVFIMRELSHRTKNILAVIQAVARQTARTSLDLEDFDERFSPRIAALASSHDLLVNRDWQGVAFDELVRSQLAPFLDKAESRLSIHGPDLLLTPEAAQTLGLAIHELGTNASKHGALSIAEGWIEVSWSAGERFHMIWQERGGPKVSPPRRFGFGHIVIKKVLGMSRGSDVVLEFKPEGLVCRFTAPCEQLFHPPTGA
jgi:PAS domain S-box-containing protein